MPSVYDKPALLPEQLLDLLIANGLQVQNSEMALFRLKVVSYHRLSAYFAPFLISKQNSKFKSGSTFECIFEHYDFDRELRLLVNDAIERIEITFRTTISDNMSVGHGAHWYLDSSHFKNQSLYQMFIKQVNDLNRNSQEPFIREYFKKYQTPHLPPSWMIMECLSFGTVNSIFRNLKKLNDKKNICKIFGYHPTAIESWLDSLRYTRNLCAHHARVWNRWFVISPKLTYLYGSSFNKENAFYAQIIIIIILLNQIYPDSNWKQKLFDFLDKYNSINFVGMGFQNDWRNDSVWKL